MNINPDTITLDGDRTVGTTFLRIPTGDFDLLVGTDDAGRLYATAEATDGILWEVCPTPTDCGKAWAGDGGANGIVCLLPTGHTGKHRADWAEAEWADDEPIKVVLKVEADPPESHPIYVSVRVSLDNHTLASALIEATFEGDVSEARQLDEDETTARMGRKADELGLDGLVAYAADFATSTDLDEHHAVWGNEVPGLEDEAEVIVGDLRHR